MNETDLQTASILLRSCGIDVSIYDVSFVENSLRKRMVEKGCVTFAEYSVLLEQNTTESAAFSDSLMISYSEFFRNPLTCAVLERILLPSIILKKKKSTRKEIRIWSAACAGGQEAYSLAILLEELRNGDRDAFSYRIFATDQSESQILEAGKGQFPASALSNVSLKRAGEWFTRQDDLYTITSQIRENVDFSVFNLFNEELSSPPASIFGDFDLVLCANLLFYYKNERRNVLLEKATSALIPGGFLVTGEAERDILAACNYREVFPQSAIYTRITQ